MLTEIFLREMRSSLKRLGNLSATVSLDIFIYLSTATQILCNVMLALKTCYVYILILCRTSVGAFTTLLSKISGAFPPTLSNLCAACGIAWYTTTDTHYLCMFERSKTFWRNTRKLRFTIPILRHPQHTAFHLRILRRNSTLLFVRLRRATPQVNFQSSIYLDLGASLSLAMMDLLLISTDNLMYKEFPRRQVYASGNSQHKCWLIY